ncbi:mechanosensitive ion channel family protein [Gemelliphila asaccharolytica]|uniref:Transporter, small conductance mechanosensitive ion channel MscS family protein n=1 Tax=Gemelliphila asaccharolytica TaxID=502393 RepID=A0ABR5TNB0_9BACL|nr:mechanosensitive ion channel domain-containing protein [Gemella asaccharolytica]KXB58890.1 transporter, small conductance mechanosensitive ion channel MscS family protein [Gemella asaccharolytica]
MNKYIDLILGNNIYANILKNIIYILLVLIISSISIKILVRIINYLMNSNTRINKKFAFNYNSKRKETILRLIASLVKYTIYFIAVIQILSIFGINTTGLLASAGIISVAIGFGAQTLVKDVITGFFIILEGQFDVGDKVQINSATGQVMSLGLRYTKLKANTGEIYFIPNSTISQVINYSKSYFVVEKELSIKIEEDIETLENNIIELLEKLNNNNNIKKYFYKHHKLNLTKITKIEEKTLGVIISVKVSSAKEKVENIIIREFFKAFKDRLKSVKE